METTIIIGLLGGIFVAWFSSAFIKQLNPLGILLGIIVFHAVYYTFVDVQNVTIFFNLISMIIGSLVYYVIDGWRAKRGDKK